LCKNEKIVNVLLGILFIGMRANLTILWNLHNWLIFRIRHAAEHRTPTGRGGNRKLSRVAEPEHERELLPARAPSLPFVGQAAPGRGPHDHPLRREPNQGHRGGPRERVPRDLPHMVVPGNRMVPEHKGPRKLQTHL